MTRHFYKHKVTGVVAPLNDSFAAVFGDRFERVGAPEKDDTKTVEQPAKKAAAAPADTNTADAPKEGDK